MDSIVGLLLLVAVGTALLRLGRRRGAFRSSYAGFQMALAFFYHAAPGL